MPLAFADRLLTIAVTATLTSAVWIVVGSGFVEQDVPAPASSAPAGDASPPATARREARGSEFGALLVPVAGVSPDELSDTFDDARGERRHEALDIAAPAGTPVIAAERGRLEKLFNSNAGGKTIYVRSSDRRTLYYYAHLQDYAAGLKEGQAIARGQRLGTVGSTGNADPAAPHLHFAVMKIAPDAEWWEPATAVNPYPLLQRSHKVAVSRWSVGRIRQNAIVPTALL